MKNNRIAVFANGWSKEYLELVLEGIKNEAAKDGIDVFVFLTFIYYGETDQQSKSQLNIFHLPNPKDFDGAIMMTNTFNLPDEQERISALFGNAGVPMVTTEVRVPGMAYIGTDNYRGEYQLATHLIEKHNVRNIVYMRGIKDNNECAIRRKALEDALHEHGLKLLDVIEGDFGFATAQGNTAKWLDAGNELPEAFVCANDHMALGVATELNHRGIDVPGDVIVTGFDHCREAQVSFPLTTTVSRSWDKLGGRAYNELMKQIDRLDPTSEIEYDSSLVATESCGCKPTEAEIATRLEMVRGVYLNSNKSDMIDFYFHDLRLAMSTVESKEEFNAAASGFMGYNALLGNNFWICTEPSFFNIDSDETIKRMRGYSPVMDVLYEKRDGASYPLTTFESRYIIPGYKKVPGGSDVYVVAPLCNSGYTIGYVAVKNNLNTVFDGELRKWIFNMNSMFITIRQYIFAQMVNRKLKEIYMNDFLSEMYNRTGCEKVIFSHIEEEKAKGHSSLLLFADIDGMKRINDRYGHLNGDLAIKATAAALRGSLPGEWLLGRYGGDEFIAVGSCPEDCDPEEAREKLSSDMSELIPGLGLSFRLTVSVGYKVIRPNDEGTIEDFIRAADGSMYGEKQKAHAALDMIDPEDTDR